MGFSDQLLNDVNKILKTSWKERDGEKVPESDDIKLDGNEAVKLKGTVLYADLAESTQLVDGYKPQFAAEIYKSYLLCASKIISAEGGSITAYDGDRIMAVFIGKSKNTTAARCALKINHAVSEIINPAIKGYYTNDNYSIKHAVGVDSSDLFVARTGIRGSNDLVWVGRAANHAAKLCSLRSYKGSVWITADVYDNMSEQSIIGSSGQNMWTREYWNDKSRHVYYSNWIWKP